MYGVFAANSPAQVSMRLNTGRTFSARRAWDTSASLVPASLANRASEKPSDFKWRKPSADVGRPFAFTLASSWTSSCIWRRNQRSNLAIWWMRSTLMPARRASAATSRRSGVGRLNAASISSMLAPTRCSTSSKPVRPVSRPRSAFCTLSCQLRPMAITSPTDFMAVPSRFCAPLNFSKAKRGILVTI